MTWQRIAAALAALVVLVFLVRRCGESEEDRVRAVIDGIETAVEAKDIGDVMAYIADTYKDGDGLGKNELRFLLLREAFTTKEKITVQRLGGIDVTLRGPKKKPTAAVATFRALVVGGSIAAALKDGETYDFEVDLRPGDDGAWRVESHKRLRASK